MTHADKYAIPPPTMTWAQRIYEFRYVHRCTQRELADWLATSVQTVSNWEGGHSTPWPNRQAVYLARMLELANVSNQARV